MDSPLFCVVRLPYSGTLSRGANFAFFVDRSAFVTVKIDASAISIALCLHTLRKLKQRKFLQVLSEAILRNFALAKIFCYMVIEAFFSKESWF